MEFLLFYFACPTSLSTLSSYSLYKNNLKSDYLPSVENATHPNASSLKFNSRIVKLPLVHSYRRRWLKLWLILSWRIWTAENSLTNFLSLIQNASLLSFFILNNIYYSVLYTIYHWGFFVKEYRKQEIRFSIIIAQLMRREFFSMQQLWSFSSRWS